MMEKLVTLQISKLVKSYCSENPGLEESTIKLTERVCRYMISMFGDIEISSFNYDKAQRFQSWILRTGRNKVTANIYCKTVRPVFRWAVLKRLIKVDPFESLKLFRIPKPRLRIFEPAEFKAMLESCPSELWRARLLMGKTAGMRKGEVLNLTTEDVDFNKGVIFIQPKRETKHTWRWVPKDKDTRELPLVSELCKLLTELLMDLSDGQPYLVLKARRYKRIIELKNRGLLSDRIRKRPDENWSKPWTKILRRAEIKDGTFKTLRRTCITEWMEHLQPHEVMRLAGHSSIDTTMRFYVATRKSLINKARSVSSDCLAIGATGFEPAAS